ncbi:MAG: DNA-binding GntR family transcriptional regulator, partial [Cellvibrionaceae bacterium]
SNSSTQIAEALTDEILQGKLNPAEKLNQSAIATQFGVSKIPVREALHRLEANGLITFQANGSATVSTLSLEEAGQIYLMRIALECLLLRHAVLKLEPVDFVKAENAMRLIDHEPDAYRWMMLNWDFHMALYAPAAMPYVVKNLEKLYINSTRYFVVFKVLNYQKRSQSEHLKILEACKNQDVEGACGLLEAHLVASKEALDGYL